MLKINNSLFEEVIVVVALGEINPDQSYDQLKSEIIKLRMIPDQLLPRCDRIVWSLFIERIKDMELTNGDYRKKKRFPRFTFQVTQVGGREEVLIHLPGELGNGKALNKVKRVFNLNRGEIQILKHPFKPHIYPGDSEYIITGSAKSLRKSEIYSEAEAEAVLLEELTEKELAVTRYIHHSVRQHEEYRRPQMLIEQCKATLCQAFDEKQLDGEELKHLLIGYVRSLVELHKLAVYHFDIKADNLFIGMDGKPLVGDFGCAIKIDEVSIPSLRSRVAALALTRRSDILKKDWDWFNFSLNKMVLAGDYSEKLKLALGKIDVWQMGKVFDQIDLPALRTLAQKMLTPEWEDRLTMNQVLEELDAIGFDRLEKVHQDPLLLPLSRSMAWERKRKWTEMEISARINFLGYYFFNTTNLYERETNLDSFTGRMFKLIVQEGALCVSEFKYGQKQDALRFLI